MSRVSLAGINIYNPIVLGGGGISQYPVPLREKNPYHLGNIYLCGRVNCLVTMPESMKMEKLWTKRAYLKIKNQCLIGGCHFTKNAVSGPGQKNVFLMEYSLTGLGEPSLKKRENLGKIPN